MGMGMGIEGEGREAEQQACACACVQRTVTSCLVAACLSVHCWDRGALEEEGTVDSTV